MAQEVFQFPTQLAVLHLALAAVPHHLTAVHQCVPVAVHLGPAVLHILYDSVPRFVSAALHFLFAAVPHHGPAVLHHLPAAGPHL